MIIRLIIALFFLIHSKSAVLTQSDSLRMNRAVAVHSGVFSTWAGGMTGLYAVWYKDFPQSGFHTFDDSRQWLMMDKLGHAFTAYQLADGLQSAYRWAGYPRKKAAFLSSAVAWGFQLNLEIFDGFSNEWGFSWADLGANSLGVGLFLAQELTLEQQLFRIKFSALPSRYARYRPTVLGSSFSERLLKDYNGQQYWLNIPTKLFFPNLKQLSFVDLSIGYGVRGKLHGDLNTFTTDDGTVFHAERQLALSLDVRVDELPIKKKWLKQALRPFHVIKFPFPSLVLSRNGISGSWLYF